MDAYSTYPPHRAPAADKIPRRRRQGTLGTHRRFADRRSIPQEVTARLAPALTRLLCDPRHAGGWPPVPARSRHDRPSRSERPLQPFRSDKPGRNYADGHPRGPDTTQRRGSSQRPLSASPRPPSPTLRPPASGVHGGGASVPARCRSRGSRRRIPAVLPSNFGAGHRADEDCRKAGRMRCATFQWHGDDLRPNFSHVRRRLR
jgi:hypothetical protein